MNEEDKWREGAYLRQRRNLNAISIVLLVYSLAGGSVESGASARLPEGLPTIRLENPDVVIAFVWVALLYFMLRFWLTSYGLRRIVHDHFAHAYKTSKYVRRIAGSMEVTYKLPKGSGHGVVKYSLGRWVFSMGKVPIHQTSETIDIPDVKLPFFPFVFYAWKEEIILAGQIQEITEYYVPFILAWLAIEAHFYRPFFYQ